MHPINDKNVAVISLIPKFSFKNKYPNYKHLWGYNGKDILTVLINQQEAEKNLLLERVLKIKKETETKTIESHLTRIRNKLLKINSKLKIISRGDKVFLSYLF